jgi:hypothetical protein
LCGALIAGGAGDGAARVSAEREDLSFIQPSRSDPRGGVGGTWWAWWCE